MIVRTRQLNRRQPVFWLALALFAAGAAFAWHDEQRGPAALLAAMALLGGLALWPSVDITLDDDGITWQGWLGWQRIGWAEIRSVETDDITVVLLGEGKKFPLAPHFWSPDTRPAAEEFLRARLHSLQVPERFNPVASDATFRNTRIRRGSTKVSPGYAPASRAARLYQALCWLPPASFIAALAGLAGHGPTGASGVAGTLVRLAFASSLLMGLFGVALCVREKHLGRPVRRLVLATLLAGSVGLLLVVRLMRAVLGGGG